MDIIGTLIRLKVIAILKKWNLLYILVGSLDIFALFLAYQLSYSINFSTTEVVFFSGSANRLPLLFVLILPVWFLIQYVSNTTEIPRTKKYRSLLVEYVISAALMFLLQIFLLYILSIESLTILFILLFTVFGFILQFTVRFVEYKLLRLYRLKGYNYIKVVLIANESSIPFIDKLLSAKEWGYRVVMIFSSNNKIIERYGNSVRVIPEKAISVLGNILALDIIDEVLYIKDKTNSSEVRKMMQSCEELGVVFRLLKKSNDYIITSAVLSAIGDTKFLTFANSQNNTTALVIKKITDIYVSGILLIFLSPFFLLAGILIKLTSKGPVIYKQARVGLRGRQFYLYKFRTMVVNADDLLKDLDSQNEADGPVFKIKNDPRVTSLGRFLRKTGFDELASAHKRT